MARSNQRIQRTILALTALLALSCATNRESISEPGIARSFRLELVQKLRPGKDTQDSVRQIFGKPDLQTELEDAPGEEAWLYLEGVHRATRLSVIFDKTSKSLKSASWFVKDRDPESDLQKSKQLFGNAKLKAQRAPIRLSHVIPDEMYLTNADLGYRIVYAQSTQKVLSITWSLPSTSPVTLGRSK